MIASIRAYADALLDKEEMKLAHIKKSKVSVKELESKIAAENRAIELLEASVTKIFTSFASGKISKDAFLHKKDIINDTIACKRSEIEKWSERLYTLTTGRRTVENSIGELESLRSLEVLNREIVDLLIDRILIRRESDIEIVWNSRFSEG